VSGAWWAGSHLKLRASASNAFRRPDYTELYYADPVHRGNPWLKPETSWSYEGGAQYTLGQRLTLDGDVFCHRDRNIVDYVRPGNAAPGTPYQAENLQKLNFTGAELFLRWQPAVGQRVELGYTAIHTSGTLLAGYTDLYAFNFPSNSGEATWRSRLPGAVESRLRLQAVQHYGLGTYPLLEWMLSRDFRHVKPYLQMTNLTNTNYQEIAGVQMPGRGFLAGLEVKWSGR
jgi:iron complex outermembrane receptor protein